MNKVLAVLRFTLMEFGYLFDTLELKDCDLAHEKRIKII